MIKRTIIFMAVSVAVLIAIWGADVLSDRQYVIAVVAPAPQYALPPHEYPNPNPVMTNLSPGQSLRVLRVRYGKDLEALQVETPDGRTGWVVSGAGIKVLSRG